MHIYIYMCIYICICIYIYIDIHTYTKVHIDVCIHCSFKAPERDVTLSSLVFRRVVWSFFVFGFSIGCYTQFAVTVGFYDFCFRVL